MSCFQVSLLELNNYFALFFLVMLFLLRNLASGSVLFRAHQVVQSWVCFMPKRKKTGSLTSRKTLPVLFKPITKELQ